MEVVSLCGGLKTLPTPARRSPWHDSAPRVPRRVPPPRGAIPDRLVPAGRGGARCGAGALPAAVTGRGWPGPWLAVGSGAGRRGWRRGCRRRVRGWPGPVLCFPAGSRSCARCCALLAITGNSMHNHSDSLHKRISYSMLVASPDDVHYILYSTIRETNV